MNVIRLFYIISSKILINVEKISLRELLFIYIAIIKLDKQATARLNDFENFVTKHQNVGTVNNVIIQSALIIIKQKRKHQTNELNSVHRFHNLTLNI